MYDDIFNQKFITVNTEMFGRPSITDYIREEFDRLQMRATLVPDINWEIKYYDINSNNFKKETNRMEAKKCDRCGKLYEMPMADENCNGAEVRFKYKYIRNADNMSGKAIVDEQTRNIYVRHDCGDYVDFCPACRASLKKWFEGADKEDKKNV